MPAPPYPIRAEGPDLWYQMRLEDTMVGLSLVPKSRGARIRECVYVELVDFPVLGYFYQFIYPLDITICRIK